MLSKACTLLLISVAIAIASDLITDLPGAPGNLNFSQYSGHVTVDASNQRELFYWFVESQRDPATDKLVLWLNGGPGCSSLAGLLTEHGPFRVNSDGETLSLDPYSWNNVANVIYLESPAGVGFSVSGNKEDYTVGDARTANDAYIFLQEFFNMYPQFQGREFWITGESYGGHYVPTLAARIIEGNANLQPGFMNINIGGIMAGNPWTYMPIDNYGAVFYWWTHALISDQTFNGINSSCDYYDNGPFEEQSKISRQSDCNSYMAQANTEMGNIFIYDIYTDVCPTNRARKVVKQLARAGSKFHQMMIDQAEDFDRQQFKKRQNIDPPYQPCSDELTSQYLNNPAVQEALHVNLGNFTWYECSSVVNYNYSDVEKSVMPLYNVFEQEKLRVLVFSGDVDAIVPYSGTRQWIADLNREILQSWQPYLMPTGQVAGYYTVYEGLTFATVRNAGHMVPETQPERAFEMFSKFLYNVPL